MNWEQLKEKKCPRCSSRLESAAPYVDEFRCSNTHCLFKIHERRFEELMSSMYKRTDYKTFKEVDRNFEELNNLKL